MRKARGWICISIAATAAAAVGTALADSITVNGQRLENVLVSESSSFYYIQIPKEGRTVNVPVREIDKNSVVISDDPYYRDKLRDEFNRNRGRHDEAAEAEADASLAAELAKPAEAAPAAAGLGVPRTDVEAALKGFGIQFAPGPGRNGQPSVVADFNGAKIELVGPPTQLFGVITTASGTPQQIEMALGQQRLFLSQLAPDAAGAVGELIAEAKSSGHSQKSVGPVNLELNHAQSGESVSIEFKVTAGG